VEAAHIYELLDETYWAPSFEASMGLVRLVPAPEGKWRTGEPKPAYETVRDITRGSRPAPKPVRECDPETIAQDRSTYSRQASFAYCLVLGHDGDTAGLDHWSEALQSGDKTVAGMVIDLMRSQEFQAKYATIGLTDRAYVGFTYMLLLNRFADGAGLESYARQLRAGGMTRDDVALGIAQSSEFQSKHAATRGASAASTPG